jgi:hypothetical protein
VTLYIAQGLQVRTKKRRKLPRRDRVAVQAPDRPMQRWSLDFMSDQLADHGAFPQPIRSRQSREVLQGFLKIIRCLRPPFHDYEERCLEP